MSGRAVGLPFAYVQHIGAALLIALLSTSLIREARQPAQLYVDESEWITSGYVALHLLREHASLDRWEHAFDERNLGDWGNKNPPLGKYIIGLAVMPHVSSDAEVNYHFAFLAADGKAGVRHAPPMDMLIAARSASAVSGALALIASYLVALELLGSPLWAVLAPLFLFFLPSFQFHAVRVYTDVPELAVLSFASFGLLRYARHARGAWLLFALVCAGLACAIKFSAGAWWLGAGCYLGLRSLRTRQAWPLMAAVLLPLISFIAVNPYLYRQPLERSGALVQAWGSSKTWQQADPQLAESVVHEPLRRIALVSARGAFAPTSTPFMESVALDAVARLTPILLGLIAFGLLSLWVTGFRLTTARDARSAWRLGAWFVLGALVELALTANLTWFGGACSVGLRTLIAQARQAAPEASPARAFACVLAALWLVTALWLPFDWSRYYLPVASQMVSVYALGSCAIGRSLTWTRRDSGYPIDSLPGGVAVGVTALVAVALGWALYSVVTPPLLPN